eukprot:Hpha_TRINITY_DN1409_c0_g1::TRINITY_DN1409_c0_g1_i1::g.9545::m.9545/K00793/ribE, RIB5; riboflavin synthase
MPFTGIVEEMGTVRRVEEKAEMVMWDGSKGRGFVLHIEARVALVDCYIGASIAVNGVCLTVTQFDEASFVVNCAPETLKRTNLGDVRAGDRVNLERAARSDARSSGHYVQGHVDDTGSVLKFEREGDSLWVRIKTPPAVLENILPKGYVSVDGTSLTVCEVDRRESWFSLMLIAHTQKCIVLPHRPIGGRVNLEADVLGKYAAAATRGLRDEVDALRQRIARLEAKL